MNHPKDHYCLVLGFPAAKITCRMSFSCLTGIDVSLVSDGVPKISYPRHTNYIEERNWYLINAVEKTSSFCYILSMHHLKIKLLLWDSSFQVQIISQPMKKVMQQKPNIRGPVIDHHFVPGVPSRNGWGCVGLDFPRPGAGLRPLPNGRSLTPWLYKWG